MTWQYQGKMENTKVSLDNKCAIGARGSTWWYPTGYGGSTSESYYRVRNSRCNATIIFPETTSWIDNSGLATEWHLTILEADIPLPRDVSSTYRVYGYANHSTFGGAGTDFLVEYVHNPYPGSGIVVFKFLVANQGYIQILQESNKNTYFKQFFGTYGGITINLEYDI